jgi:aspartate aminotransferase
MIDSVSKDTVCAGRNRLYSFKNKELMATAMKFAQARLSPPLAQVAAEAALDTPQSYFDEVISNIENADTSCS